MHLRPEGMPATGDWSAKAWQARQGILQSPAWALWLKGTSPTGAGSPGRPSVMVSGGRGGVAGALAPGGSVATGATGAQAGPSSATGPEADPGPAGRHARAPAAAMRSSRA
jgi:hypothetical protein